jgi:enediyne biosynthesis protein E4
MLACGSSSSAPQSQPTCTGNECNNDAGTPDSASDDAASMTDANTEDAKADGSAPAYCSQGTVWAKGTPMFREVTKEWGLEDLHVEGTRINLADINGDGWPDLLVRRGGSNLESLSPMGTRRTWLLINNGKGKFEDKTAESGITTPRETYPDPTGRPMEVVALADVNNDGFVDVYSGILTSDESKTGKERSELLMNDGTGHFSLGDKFHPIRMVGVVDSAAGASFVDVNMDGNLDLWATKNGYAASSGALAFQNDVLFLGQGNGSFNDITKDAGLMTKSWTVISEINQGLAHSRAWSALACDLNQDGWPELMAASYGRAPNLLWQAVPPQNSSSVMYTNRSVDSGYAYDQDFTWQDNQFAACYCQANPTAEGCDTVSAPLISCTQPNWSHDSDREPFRLGGNSGTTLCADLNNDGWMDLVTTEIKHWWAGSGADASQVLINNKENDVAFTRLKRTEHGLEVPHVTGNSWDEGHMTAAAFDVDNDGWTDLYIGASDYAGNRGLLYHQNQALQFELVPIDDSFEHNRSHGVAFADIDRDGDLDLIVGHSRSRCDAQAPNNCYPTAQVRVFENILGSKGNWVQLKLEGKAGTNRQAIGARVQIATKDTTQTQEVGGGHGHYGMQNDFLLHFGLGTSCTASVTIRWPNAQHSTQTFDIESGKRYLVTEDQSPTEITK